jgi:guanylate kinase
VGAARVAELYPDALLVFVDAPDRSVQEARLRGRGDDEARIAQRLAKAEEEVARARDLPFAHVVNDDLERAVAEVEALIASARAPVGDR